MQTANPSTQVYHPVETSTQTQATAALQVQSMEVWGRARKNGGAFPSIHAYWGPLPKGMNGIEFMTNVPPTHPSPSMAIWVHGYHPDIGLRQNGSDCFAVIRVTTISKVP